MVSCVGWFKTFSGSRGPPSLCFFSGYYQPFTISHCRLMSLKKWKSFVSVSELALVDRWICPVELSVFTIGSPQSATESGPGGSDPCKLESRVARSVCCNYWLDRVHSGSEAWRRGWCWWITDFTTAWVHIGLHCHKALFITLKGIGSNWSLLEWGCTIRRIKSRLTGITRCRYVWPITRNVVIRLITL